MIWVTARCIWVSAHCFAGGRLPLPLDDYLTEVKKAGFQISRHHAMVLVSEDWMP